MRKLFLVAAIFAALFMWTCNRSSNKDSAEASNVILQESDGTYVLKLEKAARYSDGTNPSSNTAEWKILIDEPGRYKVLLTSATRDTTDLNYANTVKISFLDNQLEADPACDRITGNLDNLNSPYFLADSYMGTFYFAESGEYYIQIVSEKVIPYEALNQNQSDAETKLMSVNLTPMRR